MGLESQLRLGLLGIDEREATFTARGFQTGSEAVERLESVGRTFIRGYRIALTTGDPNACAQQLNAEIERVNVGFGFEGAAMAFALLDLLTPWRRNRLSSLLQDAGQTHSYMIHVGAGWALARFSPGAWRSWRQLDPLLRWLAVDGLGFHEGYFHPARYVTQDKRRFGLGDYRQQAFDQGLGRALWFVTGANVAHILATIEAKPTPRRGDLWSGVGLAAAYAGGASHKELVRLRRHSGAYQAHLGQGACFAAEARRRAGNACEHTDAACAVLCGASADLASGWVRAALASLSNPISSDAYERWRTAVRANCENRSLAADTPIERVL